MLTGKADVRGIEVPEVAEEEILALNEDSVEEEAMIDVDGDRDETD